MLFFVMNEITWLKAELWLRLNSIQPINYIYALEARAMKVQIKNTPALRTFSPKNNELRR